MATREENLKKINEELEKLDDEQLEKIAGGRRIWIPVRKDKMFDDQQNQNNMKSILVK